MIIAYNAFCDLKKAWSEEFCYIDTDEIPGFLLLLQNHIFIARSEHTVFIFHV